MLPSSVKVGCDLLMVVPDWNDGKNPGLAFHAMEFDQWFLYFGHLWRVVRLESVGWNLVFISSQILRWESCCLPVYNPYREPSS